MSEAVRQYYDEHVALEWQRLDTPMCRIEYASTIRLVERFFPARGRICDIASGPGRYALELARRGYDLTLIDLSSANLDHARQVFREAGLAARDFVEADARNLSQLTNAGFDAALMLGPLYHLVGAGGRQAALRELHRLLVPGGIAIVAYINAWGLMRTGITDFPHWLRDVDSYLGLLNGRAFSAADLLPDFTECYWSTPPAALVEVQFAGFEVLTYIGAEGFAGGMGSLVEKLAADDPNAYAKLVEIAVETAALPQFRDATDHLHIVLRKPVS
jgi:S-adenosylmethionine-dependent methyltransferase